MALHLSQIINSLSIKSLPSHLFPSKKKPFVKGKIVNIPALQGDYEDYYTVDVDCEMLAISIAASDYTSPDCWDLYVDGQLVCETVYMKEVAEDFRFDVVIPLSRGSEIRFVYHNATDTDKIIWYNLKFAK